MSKVSDSIENNLTKSFDQKIDVKECGFREDNLKMSSNDTNSNQNQKSIFDVTDSEIDEEMAKDNNNLQNETIDGFDFDTPEEFLLYHSRAGNLKVVDKLILLSKKNEIELDLNCKGIELLATNHSVLQNLIQITICSDCLQVNRSQTTGGVHYIWPRISVTTMSSKNSLK